MNFFRASNSYYQKTPPITEEQLHQFQEFRGLRLPDAFVALLRIQNGGSLHKTLYITDIKGEYYLQILPGIGDTRGSVLDLLEVEVFADVKDIDLMEGLLFLSADGDGDIALDYRQCGPLGEPNVATVWFDDPHSLDSDTIANSFEEFFNGLQREVNDYYIGFKGISADGDELRSELRKCLHADVHFNGNQDQPSFSIRPQSWTFNQKIWLKPNVDYAEDYDEEDNYKSRPDGFYFPEYPEYTWMIKCERDVEHIEELLEALKSQSYEFVVMHKPRSEDEISGVVLDGEEFGLEMLEETNESIIINEFGNIRIELSPEFGFEGWHKGRGRDISKSNYAIIGTASTLFIDDLRLSVGDNLFGEVEDGDEIYVIDEDTVFVNGQKREVRKS